MSHYLDIHLRADPEFAAHQLLAALYAKLHRALVQLGSDRIAVSFPDFSASAPQLGSCLRLIGNESDLADLLALDWLRGMRDHVEVTPVAAVPASASPRTLRRVQAKSNPERLRRRQMRRHGLSHAQACERIPDASAEKLTLPYVQLASSSTGQTFRLYLRLGPVAPGHVPGKFNTYGLSADATIPWF